MWWPKTLQAHVIQVSKVLLKLGIQYLEATTKALGYPTTRGQSIRWLYWVPGGFTEYQVAILILLQFTYSWRAESSPPLCVGLCTVSKMEYIEPNKEAYVDRTNSQMKVPKGVERARSRGQRTTFLSPYPLSPHQICLTLSSLHVLCTILCTCSCVWSTDTCTAAHAAHVSHFCATIFVNFANNWGIQ
jgi:hypothetical protein